MPPGTPGRVRGIVWWSDVWCWICLSVLRDPQPVTRATRVLVLEPYFGFFFLMPFWSQMAIPRNPKSLKILKNCVPEASLRALLKKSPKMIGKVIFPEGWICNPRTPVQSKHTFSFSLSSGPRLPKRSQKASQNGAFGHPNHKKTRKTNTQKNNKKWMQKVSKNDLKKDYFFVAERSPKS